jgi:predicted O-methyltransferase YrrM
MIKNIVRRLPFLNRVFEERERLRAERNALRIALHNLRMFRDPGHFYSPLPLLEEVERRQAELFTEPPPSLPGLELNLEGQKVLLESFRALYAQQPFPEKKTPDRRYFLDNPNYAHGDGVFLYCRVRTLRPAKVVEIGSGYSSCALLDMSDLFFDGRMETVFIEPYPALLLSLLREKDKDNIHLISKPLQDVDLDLFAGLKENDILFIDSSHVSKIGSDVNHIFFKILPLLQKGVCVHFHDICYPFEYPKAWVLEQGRAWNEAYLLRAFLSYNSAFRIEFFNHYLFQINVIPAEMAICRKSPGSGLWLRRI